MKIDSEEFRAAYKTAVRDVHPLLKDALAKSGCDATACWMALMTMAYALHKGNGITGADFLITASILVNTLDAQAGIKTGVMVVRE